MTFLGGNVAFFYNANLQRFFFVIKFRCNFVLLLVWRMGAL